MAVLPTSACADHSDGLSSCERHEHDEACCSATAIWVLLRQLPQRREHCEGNFDKQPGPGSHCSTCTAPPCFPRLCRSGTSLLKARSRIDLQHHWKQCHVEVPGQRPAREPTFLMMFWFFIASGHEFSQSAVNVRRRCMMQGCDASVMLESGPDVSNELKSDRNFGIKNLEIIHSIKRALEAACPRTVSCADIIAMAARDSIALSMGPRIQIPLGRRDGTSASNRRADSSIPAASSGVDTALSMSSGMGMTLEESVAILGTHAHVMHR